jgi:hypothetical protein
MLSPHVPDEDLLRRLPLPLARLYRKATNAETPLDLYLSAHYLWEAGLKMLAAIVLIEYARRGLCNPQAAAEMTTLARPSLGHWWRYVKVLLPPLTADGGPFASTHDLFTRPQPGLPNAARLDALLKSGSEPGPTGNIPATVRLDQLFDRLVECRNREIGHGAVGQRHPRHYERLGTVLLAGVAECFARVTLLTGARTVFVTDARRDPTGGWRIEGYDLTGETERRFAPLLLPPDAVAHLPVPEQLYVELRPADRPPSSLLTAADLRGLHPLVVYDRAAREVVFLNSEPRKKQSGYLCYTDAGVALGADLDPERRTAALARLGSAVRDLLTVLLGQGVRAEDVDQWAEEALAEEPSSAPAPVPPRPAGGGEVLDDLLATVWAAARAADGLTAGAVRDEYLRAAPKGWVPVAGGPTAADAVVAFFHSLARAPLQAGGVSPLLAFVRALALRLPGEFAELLAGKVRAAAAAVGESEAPAPAAREAPAAAGRLVYLMIAIDPAATVGPDRYRVKCWLDVNGSVKCLAKGDEPFPRGELPRVVDGLRRLVETRVTSLRDVRVEFFLPRELMAEAVDQWDVTVADLGANAVGAEHPVVVRSAERYAPDRVQRLDDLRVRARELTASGRTPARIINALPPPEPIPGFALRIARADASGRRLYNLLREDRAVLCAVLDEPPPAAAAPQWDLLNTLLAVGLPVLAWSRGPTSTEIVKLLAEHPLVDLPARVRELRVWAVDAEPDHPGRHVALLWDDPDRPPPDCDPKNRLSPL